MLLRSIYVSVSLLIANPGLAVDNRQIKHIILVSVDGLSASYLSDSRAEMPNLRRLAAAGVSAKGMRTSFPSVTWPAHTSLTTGPGYSFANNISGEAVVDAGGSKGTHGHDPRPDYMHAMFVACGAGIKPGAKIGVIENVDVAPTIAHLLGIEMTGDGRVLHEALSEE